MTTKVLNSTSHEKRMGKCTDVLWELMMRMLTTMMVVMVITITTNNDYWKLRIQHLMRKGIGKCTGVHKVGRKRFCLLPNHCNPSALFVLFAPFALYALCTYTLHYLHFALTLSTICTLHYLHYTLFSLFALWAPCF